MSENIRIRTTPNGSDQYVKVKLEQSFDFIEILSLKISQDKVYENFCSDYGVIVGRVVINNGFGIPNAKVSVFIPLSEEDSENPEVAGLYPYQSVNDKNSDGIRYNLLPKESDSQEDCYTPIGTFPAKREILDNPEMMDVYTKYYKYTTTTNYAGDFMIFGVPVGNYVVHVDADISNIGIASQRPYDLIDQGTPSKYFYSPTKFKESKNLNSLVQVKSSNIGVNVNPFWGDPNSCEVGINRVDIDLNYSIRPAAIFMGSIFGDSRKNSVNKRCDPRRKLGVLCEQVPKEGSVEMIRLNMDNQIEQFDIEGGRVIDPNGAWAYQIPMNLDYMITDEYGNLIASEDPNRGIPTRSSVRFRISMDEGGGTGRLRTRGKYLVPHNPQNLSEVDFNFDKTTKPSSFVDLYWNKIYTVKNFIAKVERSYVRSKTQSYVGIKDVDGCVGDKNPFPFNRTFTKNNILFTVICFILTLIATLVSALNAILCFLRNIKFLGIQPFKGIKPIKLTCNSEPETYYTPGCGDSVTNYTDCVSAVLADQFDLFQFDFYNDWVNGTLYYYLLKYKKKRRGKEKFCETNCNDYQGGTGFNDCRNSELSDTTFQDTDDKRSFKFRNGLLVKYQDQLYYPPLVLNGSNKKLYPTDIVSLGSVLNCDYQGFPKVIDYMTTTTYKLPPLIQEVDEEDGTVVTGMIEIGNKYKGLFFDINCSGVDFNPTQATNIRRQCELSVDTPESEDTNIHGTVSINEIYDQTDAVDSLTSVNRYVRDSFYLLNISGASINAYPPINPLPDLSVPANGTSFEITGNIQNTTHVNGAAYNAFRNFNDTPSNGHVDMGFQAWGNSYYMYFGLIPGSSALDKLKSKYFTSCVKTISEDYIIETNATNTSSVTVDDGSITFRFIGGTAPFTYTWTSTNYSYGPFVTVSDGIISGLTEGVYHIIASDALGNVVEKDVIVSGPQALSCAFAVSTNATTLTSNDGTVNITQIVGGTAPYSLTITRPDTTTVTYNNVTQSNSPLTGIYAGTNLFTITDSSSPVQTCESVIEITSAPAFSMLQPIFSTNISCGGDCDGSIDPVLVGGQPPYYLTITGPNSYSSNQPYATALFTDLCEGVYTIVGTDAVGQTVNGSVTIEKTVLSLGGSRVGNVITYSGIGGVPPYAYTPVDSGSTNTYTAPTADPIVGVVTDSAGCTASNTF